MVTIAVFLFFLYCTNLILYFLLLQDHLLRAFTTTRLILFFGGEQMSYSTSTSTLDAAAKFDDQGLYLSLIIGAALLLGTGGLVSFLLYTPTLWLKRFYRTNHTLDPPPLTHQPIPSRQNGEGGSGVISGSERSSHSRYQSGLSPTAGCASPMHAASGSPSISSHTVRTRRGGRRVVRRKRLGVSLPYTSALFYRPTWQDWISIEEPSFRHRLEGALSDKDADTAVSPRRQQPQQQQANPATTTTTETHSPASCRAHADASDLLTPPSQQRAVVSPTVEGSTFPTCSTFAERLTSVNSTESLLPKTPLDPQVAVYIFALKYFFSVLCIGELFTVWIMVIASSDNYMKRSIIQRDTHSCAKQDNNATGCEALLPYCIYRGDGLGCDPVALDGIYDFTVSNIHPKSWRWLPVGLLNLCFCVVMVVLTVFFVRKVGQYVKEVMRQQMLHALGYRVICLRGISGTEAVSIEQFRKTFISLDTYFPNANNASGGDPELWGGTSYDNDDDIYVVCDIFGTNCILSAAGIHHYVVRRREVTFAQPGKVQQILPTREAPSGMYHHISETEDVMANLQESIAEEKAMQRQQVIRATSATELQASADNDSPVPREEAVQLMTRLPFPSCCEKVPAVPYYEALFYQRAHQLNKLIEEVPHETSSGAVFVVFSDSNAAFYFLHLFRSQFGGFFSPMSAVIAGPPGNVFQNSLLANKFVRMARFTVLFLVYVGMMLTWSIPISFLSSLESLSMIPGIGKFLGRYRELPESIRTIITSFLPVIVLALFNIALPHIIRLIVMAMGAFNRAECDSGQLYLQYLFMVMTAVVFQAALQGGLAQLEDLLSKPDSEGVTNFFISCVTPSNGYFYAKVVTAATFSTWLDLIDPIGILKVILLRGRAHIQRNYDALFVPSNFEFPRLYSFDLMILSMGLLFHMTAPLLGLFSCAYFLVRYLTQRAKQYDRYRPSLPAAKDCTDFGVPAQVIRCVVWLYCLAELGGVLLLSLRDHSAGVILCSITFGISIILLMYVYVTTRNWTPSLTTAKDVTRFMRASTVQQESYSGASPTVASPACGNANIGMGSPTPQSPAAPLGSSVQRQQNPTTPLWRTVHDEGLLETYEHVTLNQFLFDTQRNPFKNHLLPRKREATMKYQPKHQRLAPINAAAEAAMMMNTEFVVERYWDLGMTWFEADVGSTDAEERLNLSTSAQMLTTPVVVTEVPSLNPVALRKLQESVEQLEGIRNDSCEVELQPTAVYSPTPRTNPQTLRHREDDALSLSSDDEKK